TVDTVAPVLPVDPAEQLTVTDDAGSVTGALASGDTTDDSRPELSGRGEAGDTVNVVLTDAQGGVVTGTAVIDASGAWSWTPAGALADGTWTATVTHVDAAGNETAVPDFEF
ncbi:hypothetical protein L8909_004454, partial [Salmonella enterica]|nr:hypothetical protein [Salmonella enterica]